MKITIENILITIIVDLFDLFINISWKFSRSSFSLFFKLSLRFVVFSDKLFFELIKLWFEKTLELFALFFNNSLLASIFLINFFLKNAENDSTAWI